MESARLELVDDKPLVARAVMSEIDDFRILEEEEYWFVIDPRTLEVTRYPNRVLPERVSREQFDRARVLSEVSQSP